MKNKVLVGIIVLLIGVIAFEGVYIFTHWDKEAEPEDSHTNIPSEDENNPDDNTNEDVEDYVILVDTREDGNQIVQEYEMVLNGKYQEFEIDFENMGDTHIEVRASLGETQVYWALSHLNGKDFNSDIINQEFNGNNFVVIQGTDNKNYLSVIAENYYENGTVLEYVIFNDDFVNLDSFRIYYGTQSLTLENNEDVGYENTFGNIANSITVDNHFFIRSKIENNQIYNLHYNSYDFEGNGVDVGILEERVYTINNNVLEYEMINVHHVIDSAGSTGY